MPLFGHIFTFNWKDEDGSEQDVYDKYQQLKGVVGKNGIKYIVYAIERGDKNQRLHLQGYLQMNTTKVKEVAEKLGIYLVKQRAPRAESAITYCKKDGDYFEAGVPDLNLKGTEGKQQGARTDLTRVREAIERGESYEEICETNFETVAKYPRFIQEQIQMRATRTARNSLREALESSSLRPWQQALIDVVTEDPHPRKIHWIWDSTGGTGKSWMARYLMCLHNGLILENGKKADLAYIFAQNPTKLVVFDLSRTQEDHLDHLYGLAESLKNGILTSTKYVSMSTCFRTPHVIFFANFSPDMTKWSADRYNVIRL